MSNIPQRRENLGKSTYIPSKYLSSSSHINIQYDQFCYHPCQIANFMINTSHKQQQAKYNQYRLLKWIAYATYCQPVLITYAQRSVESILGNKSIFQIAANGHMQNVYGENINIIMETLNVFCMIKGFSIELFNITKPPIINSNLTYAIALWKNCLPVLSKNRHYSACKQILSQTEQEPIIQVKQFINQVYQLKQKVIKNLILNNYYADNYKNTQQQQQPLLHQIDIQLSKYNCLVSAEYLPYDYFNQYIEVWIDRTVQLNSLLGNFVCRERFGEFQYVKGPLTYAMEKGIMLVLNNFEHISNELLVGMRTLAEQMKIFHNQKTVQARGGFKILGLCSADKMSTKMKCMIASNQYIAHLDLPKRSVLNQIPKIENQGNRQYIIEKLANIQSKMGLLASRKLWKRIQRIRKSLVQSEDHNKLWESFFTQGFKDSIELQITDLTSKIDQNRTIHHEIKYNKIIMGRATVSIAKQPSQKIVKTQYSLSILERLALCSQLNQTPLLISETGCGKTTLVQYLSELGGHHLYVYNMSSGTDVMDLVGGFKPIDCRSLLKQLFFRFIQKFRTVPGSQKNQQYLQQLIKLYNEDQLKRLLPSLSASIIKIKSKVQDQRQLRQWDQLKVKFDNINANLSKIDSNLVFNFLQGNLIKALKNGDWVLIDQINMATNDVLQKIVPLIEGKSLLLYEKGDLTYIERHQGFRIIACMNPANDSGKKPLPPNLMQKFTAINLPEPLRMDIEMMIKQIAPQLNPSEIADIYFDVKKQKTVSLRNLSRCLSYLNRNKEVYTFKRALYDALLLGFQHKVLLKKFQDLTPPKQIKGFTQMNGFLVQTGIFKNEEQQIFHLTETFLQHLKDFLRAIAGTELPVLLEGPTSAGKTSIIRYVASVSGHKCIRINNHQHTQIQQYLGNYFPDKQGKLIFRQGPLVQAVRQGHWLILDELNLARTQILECLNRLLDDNRELFIPEQQTHIKPHKNFRIFATQNPASYSGRKTLSRAFRNRFISLSFNDITIQDTMAIMKVRRPILNDSKQLATYVKKTLQSLQNYRQRQRVFSKDSVITIRDLLKWTGRKFSDKQSFMRQGYALLAQRLRTQEQKKFVEGVLLAGTKYERLDMYPQYDRVVNQYLNQQIISKSNIYVQMNKSFKRMAALTLKAVMNNEAVLLIGETGCGKTTLAQLLASISGRKFYSINCHKHTQASDLLGSLRPCVKPNSVNKFQYVNGVVIDAMLDGAVLLIDEINTAQDSVLERLNQVLQSNNIGVERGEGWETITAKEGFCIIATMNPSGDYGKKQLSPALRNRFTQIWVEPITHPEFIQQAQLDIKQMITHKLSKPNNKLVFDNRTQIAKLVYTFLKEYNCIMAPKYGLVRKMLTMRDIGWICKFMCECSSANLQKWQDRYYWALRILAIEGVNFMMGDISDSLKLANMKEQLIEYIEQQVPLASRSTSQKATHPQLQAISIVKQLAFPLLIKTDLPLQLLGITPDQRIFFSPHTQLTDLLGQFRPKGTDFIWQDETLLKTVKNGQRVALMDLNLAQQPVIEGINSLFDHRGSIFVVQLNQMFVKHNNFKPVVVLKETVGNDRRGLPNSFLNRFIKIRVKDVSKEVKLKYLQQKFKSLEGGFKIQKLWNYVSKVLQSNPKTKIQSLQYVCQLFGHGQNYMAKAVQILQLPSFSQSQLSCLQLLSAEQSTLQLLPIAKKQSHSHKQTQLTLFSHSQQSKISQIQSLIHSYITLNKSSFSVCLIGNVSDRDNMAQWLRYVGKKDVVKVILSTMTDMADMLGSYEQVDDDDKQMQMQEQMGDRQQLTYEQCQKVVYDQIALITTKYQRNRQQSINTNNSNSNKNKDKDKDSKNTITNFKYVQSRIMRTLKQSQSQLLYIQVPNQTMLQRVEKGLKIVFEQKVNIIVGIDASIGGTPNVCANTKFIPIHLQATTNSNCNIIQVQDQTNNKLNKSNHKLSNSNSNSKQQLVKQRLKYFKPNNSKLIYSDRQLRQTQTVQWIKQNIDKQSNRNIIKAWQRLYQFIINNTTNNSQNNNQASISKQQKYKQIYRQQCTHIGLDKQYKTQISNMLSAPQPWALYPQQYHTHIRQHLSLPLSKQHQQLLQSILQLFTHEVLDSRGTIIRDIDVRDDISEQNDNNDDGQQSKLIGYNELDKGMYKDDMVYNATTAHKFQYLYISETATTAGFRDQAKKLLSICYNTHMHTHSTIHSNNTTHTTHELTQYKTLIHKLKQEIQHMYTISTTLYHKQILIKYNEEEYKIIPILTTMANNQICKQSIFHYALANIPYSVNKLAGLELDMSVIVNWDIEQSIIRYMGYLAVDVGQASKWLWNVRVRDLPVYELVKTEVVANKMDYFSNVAHTFMMGVRKDKKLTDILETIAKNKRNNQSQMIEEQNEKPNSSDIKCSEQIQFAKALFNSFKPHYTNTYLNLAYHIQTQAQLKTLILLSEQDKYYLQVYNQLCLIKYSGYLPNSYKSIEQRVTKYRQQYQQIQMKKYVYRGHDNLKLLKDFYEHLIRYCQAVQDSNFNENVIRDTLNQLYRGYYHGFKDILWPIFVSFIIIHAQITKQKAHIAKQQHNQTYNDKSITQHLLANSNSTKSFQRAVDLILQKQQQEFHDAAKDYTKFQRKFKNVIIDQYTQEGVNKNKQNDQEQFKQFFGKTTELEQTKKDTILDELYMLVRKRAGCQFELKLLKNIFNQCSQFYQFVVSFQLKFSNNGNTVADKINTNAHINIFEQYSLPIVNKLSSPIPRILQQTKTLLSKYNIDSVKIIGTLCNKIQEHKAHDQVYKILIDCQYLIDKVYQLNSILPMAERINTQELVELCLRVRRIELHNWKSMLEYKINRVEKSDTLDFIHFYRNFVQIGNIGQTEAIQAKECFRMCDDFMRRSKISCYEYRLYLLGLICQNIGQDKIYIKHNINRIVNFYASLRQPIMQHWENVKKEKIRQMAEYEKLSSWNSNQYLIFKATCQKFQRKVHHILKKYQEELSMQVGTFHANLRAKFVCQSIQQFSNNYKLKQQTEKMFEWTQMEQASRQNVNRFQGVVQRIFQSLQQIKQSHHNNQSKILLIRQNLTQLQQLAQDLPVVSSSSHNLQSNVLSQEMFPEDHPQYYKKAVKYYFGMWDKLCLKTQTAWNREIVDRVWDVVEKIWININSRIPKYQIKIEAELDEETDNLLILFEKFLSESEESETLKNNHHPIFLSELHKIRLFLRQKQIQFNQKLQKKYTKIINPQQTICLMKVGYIMSSIALNLQKNGLCAKENQQQGQQSGTEEVGDGVGIGEGQAHQGAQNVGDQIQFEEQIQGHKDEEQNKDANAGKKQQNDIQMQGDFDGDMYSKQQQAEGEDDEKEGQEKQADQKMGDVDNQQREQDIKNDKGRADGSEQADVEIDGQQEGSEQLVDNQQEEKQGRKGQNRQQESEEEGQQQKSDWDDNNEQGQQINKQKGGQLQQQEQGDNQDEDDERSAESISGKLQENEGSQEQIDQEGQQQQGQNQDKMQDENQQQNDKSGEVMQQQINQQPLPEGEQEQKQKKFKKTRRTNVEAYGRQDRNSNNPLKNNQNEPQGQQKQQMGGQAEAQGAAQGQKGSGEPVHSLSAQLLKQIQNLQRIAAKQNASFMKDLNVVAHDENNQQADQNENREEQQHQLTEQENKNISTNLPAFLDADNKKQEEKKKEQEKENKKQRKQQKQKEKQMKNQTDQKKQSNKSKLQKSKNPQAKQEPKLQQKDQLNQNAEDDKNQRNKRKENKGQQPKIEMQQTVLQIHQQQYLKSIVTANKNLKQQWKKQEMKDQKQQTKMNIMQQAFEISKILQQQLKSVLEPMDNAEYRGDYKTGKKLNLKKIIPFIASNYRKDKIWLRRTQPSERNYYIMLALDDTKSMRHGQVGTQALKGLLAISLALQNLSIKTCVTGIRDSMNIHKSFQGLLEPQRIVNSFDFSHQSQVSHNLSIPSFMEASLQEFKRSESSQTGIESRQLCFIISDGKMNKDYVRPYIRQARKRDIIYVFIIVDSEKASILTTKSASIEKNGNVKMKLYMSDFPFEYFLIVRNVRELGDVLATTLLQFIQEK